MNNDDELTGFEERAILGRENLIHGDKWEQEVEISLLVICLMIFATMGLIGVLFATMGN